MAQAEGDPIGNIQSGRGWDRIALVLVLIAAVMLLGALLPFALSTGGLGAGGQGSGSGTGAGGGGGSGASAGGGSMPLADQIPVPGAEKLPRAGQNETLAERGGSGNGSQGAKNASLTDGDSSRNGSKGNLGALNPSSETTVGGSIGNPYRSNSTEVHFVVRSSTPSYWRTAGYSTYTGKGWARDENTTPHEGSIRIHGAMGQTAAYRVELRQSATGLPTIWRPKTVEANTSMRIGAEGGIQASEPLPSGTTYRGVSEIPPRDTAILDAAGTDYPESIEAKYTRLPNDTGERVGTFTTNLTGNASTPYETAVVIERWLETTKDYSLNVSEPPTEDVAAQFIFEMEEGYCEYFATSMTVMLRTQDVPARYVVGYSTGQSIGENTYLVRNMNAHAWVEVYFPEVGWVRFDPTPGSSRLRAEQQAMNGTAMGGASYNHTEEGSPGERCSCAGESQPTPLQESPQASTENKTGAQPPTTTQSTRTTQPQGTTTQREETTTQSANTTTQSEPTTTQPEENTTEPERNTTQPERNTSEPEQNQTQPPEPLTFELNRTPVPGAVVNVTVLRGNETADGVEVYFNEEIVGTTNQTGVVIATVPYTRELNISITESKTASSETAGLTSGATFNGAAPAWTGTVFATGDPLLAETNQTETNRSYTLPTNATVTLDGQIVPNGTGVLTASIQEVPVRNATVSISGTSIGETSRDGTLLLSLPTRPGNYTVRVQHGAVKGSASFQIESLNLSVEPNWPLALPGTSVTITATRGGDTESGVPIEIGGRQVGGTDDDGTLTAPLPLQDSVVIVGTQYGQVRRVKLTGLYQHAGILIGSVVGVLLVGVGIAYWRGYRLRHLKRMVAWPLAWLAAGASGLLIAVSAWIEDLPQKVNSLLTGAVERVRDILEVRTTVGSLLAEIRVVIVETVEEWWTYASAPLDEAIATSNHVGATEPAEAETSRSVRDAWERFLGMLSVERPERYTPGDLARHAIYEEGLPAQPVRTLRDVFREVEYGNRSPEDRLSRVETAIDEIEDVVQDEPANPD